MEDPLKLLLPGEPIQDVLDTLKRLVAKAKLRALVARKRHERLATPDTEHSWLLAAQEYYYMAALSSDFTQALATAVAQKNHEKSAKNNNLN